VVSEDIELTLQTGSAPGLVRSDRGQIEQAILNLVINARDAMPKGGKLILATDAVNLDKDFAGVHKRLQPGSYIRLTVTDTGCGMDSETQAHIFEPFFTTKAPGKGTGLGLATVYGTVEEARGTVVVESQQGKGSSFQIYLPQTEGSLPGQQGPAAGSMRGSETILLVEDQDAIRNLLSEILKSNGYTVLAASDGCDALQQSEIHRGQIDLVVTDLVMPRMGGRELVQALATAHPETKALYISGYAGQAISQTEASSSDFASMDKPFTPEALVRKVREVLDAAQKRHHSRPA
jgi:two-component system cell cycle sensor histidine kinase/response regulator CckA